MEVKDRFAQMVVRGNVMAAVMQAPEQWTSHSYLYEAFEHSIIEIDVAVDGLVSQGQLLADHHGRGVKASPMTVLRWLRQVRQELPYAPLEEVLREMPYEVPRWWARKLLNMG